MNRCEPTVVLMLLRRFFFVIAMLAIPAPVALAAEKTTAVWTDRHTSALSDEELIRNALASPGPGYPHQAQKAKIAGSGVYELRVNKAGTIREVVVAKSSGSDVLDKAATTAFKQWRFKPGVFSSVRIPVSWSVNPVRVP